MQRDVLLSGIFVLVLLSWSLTLPARLAPRGGESVQSSLQSRLAARLASAGRHAPGLDPVTRDRLREMAAAMLEGELLRRAVVLGETLPASAREELSGWYLLQARADAGEEVPELTERGARDLGRLSWLGLWLGFNVLLGLVVVLSWPVWRRRLPEAPALSPPTSDLRLILAAVVVWDLLQIVLGFQMASAARARFGEMGSILVAQGALYLVGMTVLYRFLAVPWGRLTRRGLLLALACFWGCVPLVMAVTYLTGVVTDAPPHSTNPMLELLSASSSAWFALLALLVVVVGPVFEEFLFRGVLFGNLAGSIGPVWGAVASALAFSLVHGDLMGVAPLFLLGLAFAWLVHRTGSLWPAVVAHGLWNGNTLLVMALIG